MVVQERRLCKDDHEGEAMTRIARMLGAAAALGALFIGTSLQAHAATTQVNQKYYQTPFERPVFCGTADTTQLVNNSYYHKTATTPGPSGAHTGGHINSQGTKGVGETSGLTYTGSFRDNQTTNTTNGATVNHFSGGSQVTSMGNGTEQNNEVSQTVVNANGVTVVSFDKQRSNCRGGGQP